MRLKASLFACSAISGFLFASMADAQAVAMATPSNGTASSSEDVTEIIVTARRRAERSQDVPVAVTAVNSEQLEGLYIHDLADLNQLAPNFQIKPAGALFRNSAFVYARGIGYSNVDATLDPRIGISVDGVFYDRNVGALQNMFDLEGVELLLGPQGTLYGKNTVGGVITITTAKPTGEFGVKGMVRYGNFGRIDAELVANVPISPTLAFRAAFQHQQSDGYYKNTHVAPPGVTPVDKTLGGDDTQTFRGSLRWTPNDRLEAILTGTYLKSRADSVGGTNVSSPTDLASFFVGHPGFGFPGGPTGDPLSVSRSWPSGDHLNLYGLTAHVRYDAGGFDVVSLTGYIKDENPVNFSDFSNAGVNIFNTSSVTKHHQFSQEIRLESSGSGPLQWQGGVYYDSAYYNYYINLFPYFIINPPVIAILPDPIAVISQNTVQRKRSISGFGELTYAVTDKLKITAGGRLLWEQKRFVQDPQIPGTAPTHDFLPQFTLRDKNSWNSFTYRVGVDYHFTPDMMGYVSYATGWVSGGFNSGAVGLLNFIPFEPQASKSLEAGLKTSFFNRRLTANLTAFWTLHDDIQVQSYIPAPTPAGNINIISNAPQQTARGVELQVTTVPMEHLRIDAAVGYLDTYYRKLTADLFGRGVQDYSNLKPQFSPKYTVNLRASYDIQLGNTGALAPAASYSYQSAFETTLENLPQGHSDGYGLVDASLTYTAPNNRWTLALWGRNLTDKLYLVGAQPVGGLFTTAYFAQPRSYGLEFRVKFGDP